jgi:hypothetical protein
MGARRRTFGQIAWNWLAQFFLYSSARSFLNLSMITLICRAFARVFFEGCLPSFAITISLLEFLDLLPQLFEMAEGGGGLGIRAQRLTLDILRDPQRVRQGLTTTHHLFPRLSVGDDTAKGLYDETLPVRIVGV